MAKVRIGDVLLRAQLITKSQLQEAVHAQQTSHDRLGDILIDQGVITEAELLQALEIQLGIPHVILSHQRPDPAALQLIPENLIRRHMVVPLRVEQNRLVLAMVDPLDYFAIDDIRMLTGLQVQPAIASREDVHNFLDMVFSRRGSIGSLSQRNAEWEMEMSKVGDDSSVVLTVDQILSRAVKATASDIHFDPGEQQVTVRFRVDGILRTEQTLPKSIQNMVTARLKVLSNLDVAERRLPQDGRFRHTVDGREIDIRVSTLPTIHDEKTVLRLFDLSRGSWKMDRLGFSTENLAITRTMLASSAGMVLVTGPTGSGKTSTVYAAIAECNRQDVNIVTIEDPVEYQMRGINQVAVNPPTGLTFSTGLRSILRQDPDIIMVGEIRDTETAEIATRAALTGHLVFSTLHTGGAIETIARLVDMGVESYLVASAIKGIVGQRLVRSVCTHCQSPYLPSEAERKWMAQVADFTTIATPSSFVTCKGCSNCSNTGYRGRIAIQEVLLIDEEIRQLILNGSSASEIRDHALKQGFRALQYDGILKAMQGQTTISEVVRVGGPE